MYHLRRLIRERGIAVEFGLRSVESGSGGDVEPLMDEALQSKCPEDGQNLLMYSAAQGNEAWFIRLVGEVRARLGLGALVTMLREIDIDGAPLLFHAASSRREHSCFQTAYDLMDMVLGKGGVREQMEAVDGIGRGILIHAARSNHVQTFREVLKKYKEGIGGMRTGDRVSANSVSPASTALANLSDEQLLLETDIFGMNCLHHAAEAGGFEVFQEVFSICQGAKDHLYEETYKKDLTGRTPIMFVLRNGSRCCRSELKAKFEMLYNALPPRQGGQPPTGWMDMTSVPSQNVPRRGNNKRGHSKKGESIESVKTKAITELMHAARGGLPSLELALSVPLPASKDNGPHGFTVDLDKALAVQVEAETGGGTWAPSALNDKNTWGRALLLAAAAKLGDVNILFRILKAIEEGKFSLSTGEDAATVSLGEIPRPVNADEKIKLPAGREVKKAIEAISNRQSSVLSYAIMSGSTEAVEAINDLVLRIFGDGSSEAWRILSGHANESSSLTCAASVSMEADNKGLTMFDVVFSLLKRQIGPYPENEAPRKVYDLLSPPASAHISPLVGAAFSSNWILFREVYDSYEKMTNKRWSRNHVLAQIPKGPPRRRSVVERLELHECQDEIPRLITRGAWTIPAVMWRDIVKAYKRAQPESEDSQQGPNATNGEGAAEKKSLQSWRRDFRGYSRRAVEVAAERGTFAALRDLVHESFPLHDDHIPAILENIGDHEQDVIETVVAAVANASNPFVMGAGVSRALRTSEVDHPMHQRSLRRLEGTIDEFTNELLDKLPHTVRGMGMALLGGHQTIDFGDGLQQGKRHRLGNLAGFIVAQWMLEPHLLVGKMKNEHKYKGQIFNDPLRRALDRGSKGLDLINSPLVLDYVHVKFTGTLPSWTSRNPFQPTINEGFYKYGDFDEYSLKEVLAAKVLSDDYENSAAKNEKFWSIAFLLRLLQGWDHESNLKWNIPIMGNKPLTEDLADTSTAKLRKQTRVPHTTMLPGLQFSLAGILGKPQTFYQVPVIRFIFEIFGYMVMLSMFCSSVLLKEHDFVPFDEVIFYVFTAGMVCREILEFWDNIPARRHKPHRKRITRDGKKIPLISCRGTGQRFNRMVSAFTRYVFYDTWNFLDTSTICCILVAFIFRMVALTNKDQLFYAQLFFAMSAPLLFSRLLVLSQIDATLGPMTQVIWRMMSHTLRFSAFIAMVMLSFALAFHAVFHTCGTSNCSVEPDESPLRDAFGTFGRSFVTVFSSALGGPDFDIFEGQDSDCNCDLPEGARSAGIFLMVAYMITMSVVLLNLLIAVLSTAHDEVYANAEKEFHLARARLIYQSAQVVSTGRPPPPLNLLKVVFGLLVDTGTEVWRLWLWVTRGRAEAKKWGPASNTHKWKTFEGSLQRRAFAWTLGAAAVVLSAVLWILSVPWVAWCLLRVVRPVEEHPSDDDDDEQNDSSTKREIKVVDDDEKPSPGYFWALFSGIKAIGGLLFGIMGASALCFTYILCSILLWALGQFMVGKWLVDNWGEPEENIPEAMAGQEKTCHWKRAWELACLRNNGVREEDAQANFHVVPLLKSKTGLDMQHLARLSNARDAKSTSEKELMEVDRKLPDARIDLEHLLQMVKSRADQRRKDPTSNATPAAQPPVAPIAGGENDNGGGGREGGGGDGGGGTRGTNGEGRGGGRADSNVGDNGGKAGAPTTPTNDPASAIALANDRGGDGHDASPSKKAPAFDEVGTVSVETDNHTR
eukprot:g13586.t1